MNGFSISLRGEILSPRRIYFIGIGGISMSSLAMITKSLGLQVAGSDYGTHAMIDRLKENGITVHPSHRAEQVEGFDLVVYTAAIHPDNPEYAAAKELGIPMCTRARYLGQLMLRYPNRLGIAGMHGKSTTTSMAAQIFLDSRRDPTVVSGAECACLGGAYVMGMGEDFIFEACEYTDSFLSFFPTAAVVLNIDMDHPDYFRDLSQIIRSYASYMALSRVAIVNGDDQNVAEAVKLALEKKPELQIIRFAVESDADLRAENIRFEAGRALFDIIAYGKHLCQVSLAIPGIHGVYDALAAAAAAAQLHGIGGEDIAAALGRFTGAKRRLERKGSLPCGAVIYDDYAHHPTEIVSTLAGVKKLGFDRILCVFQPHTYTRTAELFDDFAAAFSDADEVVFADIYAARETNESGISSRALAKAAPNGSYRGDFAAIASYLRQQAREGDVILTVGAGDVFRIGDMLLETDD